MFWTGAWTPLRLRGQGLPNPSGRPGDLYAEVSVAVTPTLTDRERALFEEAEPPRWQTPST